MPDTHSILQRWEISEDELTDLVDQNPSLRGMMLGYVAEKKFHDIYLNHPAVTEVAKDDDHDRKKKGDRGLLYKGHSLTVEVKSLQTNTIRRRNDGVWVGKAQVDASDRRVIQFPDRTELNTTLLQRGEFDLLAVNCFGFEGSWKFVFARNSDLPCSTFRGYTKVQQQNLLASLIEVTWPPTAPFTEDFIELLDQIVSEKR